jgi:hypothetical protein
MSRKTHSNTPNAFARMTAAMKLPAAANAAPAKAEPKPEAASKVTISPRAATRQNTKIVAGHFPEPMHRALRIAGAEEGLTVQQILEEALHDWLVKKGATKHLNK